MSAIAGEMGGSKATLWAYFSSKEELFAAAIDRATKEFRAELVTILDRQDDPKTTLVHFCEQFLLKATSPQAIALQRVVIGEAGRFPEIGRIFYERGPMETNKLLARYLKILMDQGTLREDEPLKLALFLIGHCFVGLQQLLLMKIIEDVDIYIIKEVANSSVEFFLSASEIEINQK